MATADPKAVRLPQLGRNKLHRSALGGMDKSILALVAFAAIALSGALLLAALILSSAASVGGLFHITGPYRRNRHPEWLNRQKLPKETTPARGASRPFWDCASGGEGTVE